MISREKISTFSVPCEMDVFIFRDRIVVKIRLGHIKLSVKPGAHDENWSRLPLPLQFCTLDPAVINYRRVKKRFDCRKMKKTPKKLKCIILKFTFIVDFVVFSRLLSNYINLIINSAIF